MRASLPRRARGFTLVEVMIASAVMAIGLTGVVSMIVAAKRLDRRTSARAAAHGIAMELAHEISRWEFTDPRLGYVHDYAGAEFAEPTVESFSVTPGAPPTVTETLSAPPDHGEEECGPCGRDLAVLNGEEPGRIYLYRRYWNVAVDPNNPHLKLVAVHVTYSRGSGDRAVATAFTSVHDRAALLRAALRQER